MKNLGILIFLLLNLSAFGREKSMTVPLTFDQKYEMVKQVYDRVFQAMGILDIQPELVLDDKRSTSVAYLKRNKDGSRTLAVEEKAFDICYNHFGNRCEEALAFLIGHELGHFRYNHQWGKDFASSFALADIEDKLAEANDKLSELKYFETQADHSGGISCFLAGYDIRGLGEPLLKTIYAEYKLPEEAPKYPSLKERIELTRQNDSIVGRLITVFEAGNYALMIGEYAEAVKCLEFVINKGFKSREIYNNIGVAALLQAMNLTGKDAVKYVYPVEIDVESRLSGAHKGFSDETKKLIEKAKTYFTLAVALDKYYHTGYINLACAYAFKDELPEAHRNIDIAEKMLAGEANDQQLINACVIRAIVFDKEKKTALAKQVLTDRLKLSKSYLAEINLEIIKGKKAQDFSWSKKLAKEKLNIEPTGEGKTAVETIDGVTDLVTVFEEKETVEIPVNKSAVHYLAMKNSEMYGLTTSDNHELYFHQTLGSYEGKTGLEIAKENSLDDLLKAYGLPDVVFNARGEQYMVFKKNNLIVKLTPPSAKDQGRVTGWIVYKRY